MIQPADSVRIAIFNATNPDQFLIVAEADDPSNWKLVGGKFEPGETPDEAAARELAEEVALSPAAIQLVSVGELINNDGHSRRFIYAGVASPDQIKPTSDIASYRWVTLETIPDGPNLAHITTAVTLAAKH